MAASPRRGSVGLVNRVVPRPELDAAVDRIVERLLRTLPEVTRYPQQQLNFWRDLSWSLTVQHAREWLRLHSAAYETLEGLVAFREKRAVDAAEIRRRGGERRSALGPA